AAKVARKWLDDGLAAVEKVIASPKDTEDWLVELLRKHFKIAPTDKGNLGKLRDGLSTIQSNFDRALFKCTTDCDEKGGTYRPGKTETLIGPYIAYGRIQLCTTVLEDGREVELAETILHEMGHRFAGKNQDPEYYRKKGGGYFALPTETALNNADSFAQFSKDVSNVSGRKAEAAKEKEAEAAKEKEAAAAKEKEGAAAGKKTGGGVKRKAIGADAPAAVPSSVHEVLHSPGEPLAEEAREWMEPRFGHDFGDVKVHADMHAAASARDVNAAAYTVGRDVVFGAGRYEPETKAGRELLAHELTHVVQQRGQADSSLDSLQIRSEGEREADQISDRIANGDSVLDPLKNNNSPVSHQALQRQEKPAPQPATETKPEAAPETKPEAAKQPEQPGGVPVID